MGSPLSSSSALSPLPVGLPEFHVPGVLSFVDILDNLLPSLLDLKVLDLADQIVLLLRISLLCLMPISLFFVMWASGYDYIANPKTKSLSLFVKKDKEERIVKKHFLNEAYYLFQIQCGLWFWLVVNSYFSFNGVNMLINILLRQDFKKRILYHSFYCIKS